MGAAASAPAGDLAMAARRAVRTFAAMRVRSLLAAMAPASMPAAAASARHQRLARREWQFDPPALAEAFGLAGEQQLVKTHRPPKRVAALQ